MTLFLKKGLGLVEAPLADAFKRAAKTEVGAYALVVLSMCAYFFQHDENVCWGTLCPN